MKSVNIDNNINEDAELWRAYNKLLVSKDIGRLQKLNARYDIFKTTLNIPGSIVECGVFKGAGLMHWLKLLKLYTPFEKKHVFGFDTFTAFSTELKDFELQTAKEFVDEAEFVGINRQDLEKLISSFDFDNFTLIEGEVSRTIPLFVSEMSGLRLSLVNLDFDTYQGTKTALESFYPIMSPGSVFILDEYGKQGWGESDAVDEFLSKNNLKLESVRHANQPTAIIRMPN